MRIDQLLPYFSYGDAIGNYTIALRRTLRRWGFTSEIFCYLYHEKLSRESRTYEEYARLDSPDNVLIYHYSIGHYMTSFFSRLKCRKVMIYHNITPGSFFEGVNRRARWECEQGRRELALLAGKVELALGDSEFNRRELEGLSYSPTGVLPIFVPLDDYRQTPDQKVLKAFGDGRVNILHVSRFAPNKRIEDLIKTFYFFRKARPGSRLVLVGTDTNMENYTRALRDLVLKLGLADNVIFTGHVTFAELLAYYRTASAYLLMSEHEGFCVPLLECMIMEVPVVAFSSSAVPDTLDGAGILFREKDHPQVAGLLESIVGDPTLKRSLVEAGHRRLADFQPGRIEASLSSHLGALGIFVPAHAK